MSVAALMEALVYQLLDAGGLETDVPALLDMQVHCVKLYTNLIGAKKNWVASYTQYKFCYSYNIMIL